jgi:hypothetical protein
MEDVTEIKDAIREIQRDIRHIDATLVRNTVSLEVHEKRTDASEKRIEKLENGAIWVVGLALTAIVTYLTSLMFKP